MQCQCVLFGSQDIVKFWLMITLCKTFTSVKDETDTELNFDFGKPWNSNYLQGTTHAQVHTHAHSPKNVMPTHRYRNVLNFYTALPTKPCDEKALKTTHTQTHTHEKSIF